MKKINVFKIKNVKLFVLVSVFIIVIFAVIIFLSYNYVNKSTTYQDNFKIIEPAAELDPNVKSNNVIDLLNFSQEKTVYKDDVQDTQSNFGNNISLTVDKNRNTLNLYDDAGNQIKEVSKNVTEAKIISENEIAYQMSDNQSSSGIYIYYIKEDKAQLIIPTYDTGVFNNVVFINNDKYFFIQPTTGKIGFGTISTNQTIVLDEKLLPVKSNYTSISAYSFPSISPDKKFIAFFDKTPDQDNKITLKVIKSDVTSKDDVYYETKINLTAQQINTNFLPIQWSNDSKYVFAGDEFNLINIENKSILFQTNNPVRDLRLSPDNNFVFFCNISDSNCFVQSISNKSPKLVSQYIAQSFWITENKLLLRIGERIYLYDSLTDKLTYALEDKANYEIISVDQIKKQALIKNGSSYLILII